MTPDKRAILEAAARACGLPKHVDGMGFEQPHPYKWNPIDNSADTSAMCAVLDIDTFWRDSKVSCSLRGKTGYTTVPHDGTPEGKEAAQRLAATMVAAKIGGYEE
jgi:hypothetical protein